jgi:serine/threonine-protein kinase
MHPDVAEAHRVLQAVLTTAHDAAREYAAAQQLIAGEERALKPSAFNLLTSDPLMDRRVRDHRLRGTAAKRATLDALFASWVQPFGLELTAVHQAGADVSGYEIVSWPARVHALAGSAIEHIDAFRRLCPGIVAFADYDKVVDDWWSALVPGVPPPGTLPTTTTTTTTTTTLTPGTGATPAAGASAVADAAVDRLARVWGDLRPATPSSTIATNATTATNAASSTPAADDDGDPLAPPAATARTLDDDEALAGFLPRAGGRTFGGRSSAMMTAAASAGPPSKNTPDLRSAAALIDGLEGRDFVVGGRIGRFTLLQAIGRGGRSEVFRARLDGAVGFSREVALKRLHIDHADDPHAITAFVADAARAARLAHPNVVPLLDLQTYRDAVGETRAFAVMELLTGATWGSLLVRARARGVHVDRAILVRAAVDTARGLHAAHALRHDDGSRGVVHRAVSPDKLFLATHGTTLLLGFGVSRRLDQSTASFGNDIRGRVPFLAPEQITGGVVDARSDLFALGATLYWMFAGTSPWGETANVATAVLARLAPPQPLATHVPEAGAITTLVDALLAVAPGERPASAAVVVDALERLGPAPPEAAADLLARVADDG